MSKRTLVLRAERLSDLTTAELSGVVAGANDGNTKSCPDHTYYCITGWAICGDIRTATRINCSE